MSAKSGNGGKKRVRKWLKIEKGAKNDEKSAKNYRRNA